MVHCKIPMLKCFCCFLLCLVPLLAQALKHNAVPMLLKWLCDQVYTMLRCHQQQCRGVLVYLWYNSTLYVLHRLLQLFDVTLGLTMKRIPWLDVTIGNAVGCWHNSWREPALHLLHRLLFNVMLPRCVHNVQVSPSAMLWGAGTALGEIPPYAFSYQAAKAGRKNQELEKMFGMQQASAQMGLLSNLVARMQNWMLRFIQRSATGVMLGAMQTAICPGTD